MADGTGREAALAVRMVQAAALGLASGLGFVLPILVMLHTMPGRGRTIRLIFVLLVAMLLIRRLGRILHKMLDRTEQPLRFPLLALYAVAAMVPPVSLLLVPASLR